MWNSGVTWLVVALGVAGVVTAVLSDALARARRAHRAAFAERGLLMEREREGVAQAAVAAERARIATELHDIVSHNVSLMIVQTGAAREVLATMPAEAEASMRAVEAAGRSTMTELRQLLGVLAPSPSGEAASWDASLAPQPSLTYLGSLVDRISFAGLPVEVRVEGEARSLPAGVDVTAYRIVQETLTNALKHGRDAEAKVTVRYSDRYLRVEVLNTGPSVLSANRLVSNEPAPAPPNGAGRGLLGLQERVALYGGDMDARRRLGGGFRVRARIPLDCA